jgi:hypothetical protein
MSWDALRIPTIPRKYFLILESIFVVCKAYRDQQTIMTLVVGSEREQRNQWIAVAGG